MPLTISLHKTSTRPTELLAVACPWTTIFSSKEFAKILVTQTTCQGTTFSRAERIRKVTGFSPCAKAQVMEAFNGTSELAPWHVIIHKEWSGDDEDGCS